QYVFINIKDDKKAKKLLGLLSKEMAGNWGKSKYLLFTEDLS
ncbi:MAG: hypothetical protein ACI88H_002986, partial [Cocleimonas sp.]